jgi:hypothetical protein
MGTADGDGRTARVRAWVAEQAESQGAPVSVPILCETAVARLGISGATQTVEMSSGWPETRYATDDLGARLAELQVTVGDGPYLDVRRDGGGPVLVPDLDSPAIQRRWPLFAPLAVQSGAGALFVLPMTVGTIRVGTLALHARQARHLDAATLADALAFADLALHLHLDPRVGLSVADNDGIQLYGAQVHQATGMVSVQLDVGMEDAFNRLRARALVEERPLIELATDVVARRLRFDPTNEAS